MREEIELVEMNETQVEELVNRNMRNGDNRDSCCSPCEYDVFCVVSYLVQRKEEYDQQANRRNCLISQPSTSSRLSRLYSVDDHYSSGTKHILDNIIIIVTYNVIWITNK